ncbi:MAG: hypothetical protein FJ291_25810 [Planctomycetes bacterium]|nr:hypothetical protein [Planctomycetota bacterium]
MIGLAAAEVALAALVGWLLVRSGVCQWGSRSAQPQAGDAFILGSALGCLALVAFVLGAWQWRLGGRDRVRLLLTGYLMLVGAFAGLCWFDISMRGAKLPPGPQAPSELWRTIERSAAAALALGSLFLGVAFVLLFLWLARRSLKRAAENGILKGD